MKWGVVIGGGVATRASSPRGAILSRRNGAAPVLSVDAPVLARCGSVASASTWWRRRRSFAGVVSVASASRSLHLPIVSRPEHEKGVKALGLVLERFEAALSRRSEDAVGKNPPRVVTLIPPHFTPAMVIDCYNAGLRHFGESASHQLIQRAEDEEVLRHCPEIKWHYYGLIQPSLGNNRLVRTANLHVIESVHNETVANILEKCVAQEKLAGLKVMVRVCPGAVEEEESSNGVTRDSAHELCRHILEDCPHLELCGLAAEADELLGQLNASNNVGASAALGNDNVSNNGSGGVEEEAEGDADLFSDLTKARLDVCRRLHIEVEDFELSMGSLGDLERAVELGSSTVRVGGSQLFGELTLDAGLLTP